MMTEELKISQKDMRLILSAASPDAALLYLYVSSGNELSTAAADLHMNESRLGCAEATLRQLGLMVDDRVSHIAPGERPGYSERDVLEAMDGDASFRGLYGEVQRLLGRSLNTEELKILLGFVRYLGMTPELISVLVTGGFYDAEDCYGAFRTYEMLKTMSPDCELYLAAGPWYHGGWNNRTANHLADVWYGEKSGAYYQDSVEFPFFSYYLEGKGVKPVRVNVCPSGEMVENTP